jgi:hypothetical protein
MDRKFMPVKIFFCYAHEDEDLLNTLKTHLRPLQRTGLIDVWYDRDISGGARWEEEINTHLNEADIILLLVSSDFMDSDYCYGKEMQQALERDQRGEAQVIPIILRPTHWQETPFGMLQALPKDGIPVTDNRWNSRDDAFYNVTEGIKRVVEEIIQQQNRTFPNYSEPLNPKPPLPLTPKGKVSTAVKVILTTAILLIVSTLIGGVFILKNHNHSSASTTPTATNSTRTPLPTSSPQSPFLYQADFLKGDQGWFKYAQSSQWSYNANDKALESDGSLYCCSASTISTITIVAPYIMMKRDYTIKARIRVTGINTSHSYKESDPQQDPFFGLYVRGDAENQEGYMAGINGLPIGQPNAGAYSTFLAYGSKIPPPGKVFHGKEGGGKDFVLDNNWHDYRLDVKGDTFMLIIDNKPYYSAPMQDSYFPDGPHVGIEDYDFYLQVQNFTVSVLLK